jgi:hypothetical protein
MTSRCAAVTESDDGSTKICDGLVESADGVADLLGRDLIYAGAVAEASQRGMQVKADGEHLVHDGVVEIARDATAIVSESAPQVLGSAGMVYGRLYDTGGVRAARVRGIVFGHHDEVALPLAPYMGFRQIRAGHGVVGGGLERGSLPGAAKIAASMTAKNPAISATPPEDGGGVTAGSDCVSGAGDGDLSSIPGASSVLPSAGGN